MIQSLNLPVSVTSRFSHKQRKTIPLSILWEGREHPVIKIGLHHTYRKGRILYHVFSVSSQTMYFKLVLNTDNLHWVLEEISDGEVG